MIDFKYKGYEIKVGGIANTTKVTADNGMDSCVWWFSIDSPKQAKWHRFIKTDIQGGKYHLLDLKESIDNAVDEFHRLIPVDNDSDLQDLWNTVSRCCQKFIEDNKEKEDE